MRRDQLGKVYYAPLDVVFSEYAVVQPDLIFVSRERSRIITERIRGAPDLIIEVLSPTTQERDLSLKRSLYLKSGVEEYWVVDPDARTIQIWRGASSETLRGGKITLSGSVFAGLEFELCKIFAR